MLNLAFANKSNFIIDTYEIDKGGISYSFETTRYIMSKHKSSKLYLLIGSDQAMSLRNWKEWEWLFNNTQVCIAMRDGFSTKDELIKSLKFESKLPIILNSPLIKLSATEIRTKLKNNESIKEFVPPDVADYIKRNKLFQS